LTKPLGAGVGPDLVQHDVKLREAWSALMLAAPDSRAYVVSVAGRANAIDALREQALQAARALEGGS